MHPACAMPKGTSGLPIFVPKAPGRTLQQQSGRTRQLGRQFRPKTTAATTFHSTPIRTGIPHRTTLRLSYPHQIRSIQNAGNSSLLGRLRALQKSNPVALPAALITVIAACGTLVAVTYAYMAYFVPIDTRFPEPVARKLKRALYYGNQEPSNAAKAWDYYRQALQAAEEQRMHPFSDEVLGIKISAAAMLERANLFRESARVLDGLRADCLRFVEWCETREDEGVVVVRGRDGSSSSTVVVEGGGEEGSGGGDEKPVTTMSDIKRARTRVLGRIVGMCVKLGELYSNVYVNDLPAAERCLTEGVELALKEHQRRDFNKVKPEEEGEWLSMEELGGTLEALANHYESKSKHSLAGPLYLRAITLAQPPSCHTAVLMNNLAISLAQTLPERNAVSVSPGISGIPIAAAAATTTAPTSRAALISNARSWTDKALEIGRSTQAPTRTEECDEACAVATHNLGEFAEMEGLVDEARKRYEEAKRLAKGMGFSEGVKNADKGLKRLKGST